MTNEGGTRGNGEEPWSNVSKIRSPNANISEPSSPLFGHKTNKLTNFGFAILKMQLWQDIVSNSPMLCTLISKLGNSNAALGFYIPFLSLFFFYFSFSNTSLSCSLLSWGRNSDKSNHDRFHCLIRYLRNSIEKSAFKMTRNGSLWMEFTIIGLERFLSFYWSDHHIGMLSFS